jgi:hypothetical protein
MHEVLAASLEARACVTGLGRHGANAGPGDREPSVELASEQQVASLDWQYAAHLR